MKVVTPTGSFALGVTETTPTIGIVDYSRRVTDDFGVTTVVERGFARRMSVRFAVPFDEVDALQRRLADLRATPATWIADDRFASLAFEGFYKDFSIDLAVPPVSFCTLTVEGLAGGGVAGDLTSDPAPIGQVSTLQLLQPVTIGPTELTSTSVPETDFPAWSSTATYAVGARVVADHRIYESLVAANSDHNPANDPARWLDVGSTNRWAMFDQALGSATTSTAPIAVTLAVGTINAVALLDVVGTTARVQTSGYDRTIAIMNGAAGFLDLPTSAAAVTVTIDGPAPVSIGTLLVGRVIPLGITEAAPTAGITDFSRKDVDDFGEVSIVQRAWSKKMTVQALIRTDATDVVADRIASVRARPSLWIGQAGIDSLTLYGFFRDFSIEVGETVSKLSLSIEGLSKAAPVPLPLSEQIGAIAQQIDRGAYLASTKYWAGNIVSLPDGSRWRFDGVLPASGLIPMAGSAVWTLIQAAPSVIPPTTVVGGTRDPVTGVVTGGVPASIVGPRLERIPAIETAIERIPALDVAIERIPAIVEGVELLRSADIDQEVLLRQLDRDQRRSGTASLAAVIGQYDSEQRQITAAAQVKEETFARIDAGDAAEAGQRLLLTAQVGDVDARLGEESLVRATETEALARDLDAMAVTVGQQSAGITRLDEAVANEVEARAEAVSTVRAELVPLIDAAGDATDAVDARVTGEVARLDQAIVEGDAASAQAASSVRAELVPLIDAAAGAAGAVNTRVTGEVARLDQAIVEGDAASAQAASSVRAELVPLIDAAAGAAGVVNTRVTGEVARLDQAIVEGDAASAQAASSVRAELIPLIDAAAGAAGVVNTRVTGEVARLDQAIVEGDAASAQAASSVRAELEPLIDAAAGAASLVNGRVTSEVARLDQAVVDERGARAQAVADVSAELDGKIVVVQDRADAAVDLAGRLIGERTLAIDVNGNVSGIRILGSEDGPGEIGVFNADIRLGVGQVIATSGGFRKVDGAGVGVDADMVLWFGPDTIPRGAETRGNCRFALGTDGKVYFGGTNLEGQIGTGAAVILNDNERVVLPSTGSGAVLTRTATVDLTASDFIRLSLAADNPQANTGSNIVFARVVISVAVAASSVTIVDAVVSLSLSDGTLGASSLMTASSKLYPAPGAGPATVTLSVTRSGPGGNGGEFDLYFVVEKA